MPSESCDRTRRRPLVTLFVSLISDAIALPLVLQPLVTLADKDVTGVEPRGGTVGVADLRGRDVGSAGQLTGG